MVVQLDLLTRNEVAGVLRVSIPTIDRRVRDGTLKPLRLGRRVLFPRADVEALLTVPRSDLTP